jgi:thiamine kinase-like enzyme
LYETIAHSYGITLSPAYVKTKSKLLNFQKMLLENLQWKPCHNDPVLENFIMSEDTGIYLIDWEYSGMNDYTWDLAAFALENNLNQDEENFLWSCYWGDDKPDTAIIKIKIYKICQDLLWYVWAKIKEAEGSDFSGYAQMRLERGCLLFKEISKND